MTPRETKSAEANSAAGDGNPTASESTSEVPAVDSAEQQAPIDEPTLVGDGDPNSWQTKCKTFSEQLDVLLTRGLWFDCKLAVGPTAEPVQAHRLILASASPVLANLLYGRPDCPIALRNIDPDTFKLVIEYIYTQKCNITSCKLAFNLYQAAHYLIMPYLKEKCKAYFELNIKESNDDVLQIYELAEKFGESELSAKCLKNMASYAEGVLAGEGFTYAHADTLEVMFSLPNLKISSEFVLFEAAKAWVLAHQNINLDNNNEERRSELKTVTREDTTTEENAKCLIHKALQQIRFLAIIPEEFSKYNMTSLLSESELLAIMLNLNSNEAYMPMPKGFSELRQKRQPYIIDVNIENIDKFEHIFDSEEETTEFILSWEFNIWQDQNLTHDEDEDDTYHIYLKLLSIDNYTTPFFLKAMIVISILRHSDNSRLSWSTSQFEICDIQKYEDIHTSWGISYINLKNILDPANGYVNNDNITFEISIILPHKIQNKRIHE